MEPDRAGIDRDLEQTRYHETGTDAVARRA
jgi:hypothetical protein